MAAKGSNVVNNLIERSPIFKSVDEEYKEKLKAAACLKTYAPGDKIIEEGGLTADVFLICTGKVQITADVAGQEIVLAELLPGEIIGEVAVVTGVARTSTATAVEPVEVIAFPEYMMLEMMNNNPKVKELLMRMVEERAMDAISKSIF